MLDRKGSDGADPAVVVFEYWFDESGIAVGVLSDQILRAVAGSVVDDEDLIGLACLCKNRIDGLCEEFTLVERGDIHRDGRTLAHDQDSMRL